MPHEVVPAHLLAVLLGERDGGVARGEVVRVARGLDRGPLQRVLGCQRGELRRQQLAVRRIGLERLRVVGPGQVPAADDGRADEQVLRRDGTQRDRRRRRRPRLRGDGLGARRRGRGLGRPGACPQRQQRHDGRHQGSRPPRRGPRHASSLGGARGSRSSCGRGSPPVVGDLRGFCQSCPQGWGPGPARLRGPGPRRRSRHREGDDRPVTEYIRRDVEARAATSTAAGWLTVASGETSWCGSGGGRRRQLGVSRKIRSGRPAARS